MPLNDKDRHVLALAVHVGAPTNAPSALKPAGGRAAATVVKSHPHADADDVLLWAEAQAAVAR